MKIKLAKSKRGSNNTHYKILDIKITGTIYVQNDVADLNPEIDEFELELPFKTTPKTAKPK